MRRLLLGLAIALPACGDTNTTINNISATTTSAANGAGGFGGSGASAGMGGEGGAGGGAATTTGGQAGAGGQGGAGGAATCIDTCADLHGSCGTLDGCNGALDCGGCSDPNGATGPLSCGATSNVCECVFFPTPEAKAVCNASVQAVLIGCTPDECAPFLCDGLKAKAPENCVDTGEVVPNEDSTVWCCLP